MRNRAITMGKIYRGFSKSGREHILEEYFDQRTGWYKYFDLENKIWYDFNAIDQASLVGMGYVEGLRKGKKRRKVLNFYLASRNKILEAQNLFFGDVVTSSYILDKSVLLEKIDFLYRRIDNGLVYKDYGENEDDEYVENIRKINDLESKVTKRKVLEYDYKIKHLK